MKLILWSECFVDVQHGNKRSCPDIYESGKLVHMYVLNKWSAVFIAWCQLNTIYDYLKADDTFEKI